jgi:hypothetical protein
MLKDSFVGFAPPHPNSTGFGARHQQTSLNESKLELSRSMHSLSNCPIQPQRSCTGLAFTPIVVELEDNTAALVQVSHGDCGTAADAVLDLG